MKPHTKIGWASIASSAFGCYLGDPLGFVFFTTGCIGWIWALEASKTAGP